MLTEYETNIQADPELERQLWRDYADSPGDDGAAGPLVEYYLPLVVRVVRRLAIQILNHVEPRDLIGVGVQGLYQAIHRYDQTSGVAFSCFAEIRIRGAVFDDLRQRDPLTRPQRRTIRQVQEAASLFASKNARFPTPEELAACTELTPDQVTSYLNMAADPVNLAQEFEDGLSYQDVIPDDRTPSPSQAADVTFGLESMRHAIRTLSEREQQLLFLRHHEELGVREIGEALKVTPGRVSQMYNEILAKLRMVMQIEA